MENNKRVDIKVGNEVYVVGGGYGTVKGYIKIKKVGRKYFYLEGNRLDENKFEISTLEHTLDTNLKRFIYKSKEQYEKAVKRDSLIKKVLKKTRDLCYRDFLNVTDNDISLLNDYITKVLGVE